MDKAEPLPMPHRPVPYHPSVVVAKPVVNADALPAAHVRPLTNRSRGLRALFVAGLIVLSLATTALAAFLTL